MKRKKPRCKLKAKGDFCPDCYRAERCVSKIDEMMRPGPDLKARYLRVLRGILMEWRARLVRENAPKWKGSGVEGNGWRSGPRCFGGGSVSCLDDTGSHGPAVRAYEDRYDHLQETA